MHFGYFSRSVFALIDFLANVQCIMYSYSFSEYIKDVYEQAIAPPPPSPPPTPQPKRTQADWERDARELAEESEGRTMLHSKKIPKYFESELGKAFLLTQVIMLTHCRHR